MRQFVLIFMALSLSFASAIAQQVPADSLMEWLRKGDRSVWLDQTESLTNEEVETERLPPAVALYFTPQNDRPVWAAVPDSVYWSWLQAGLLALEWQWDAEVFSAAAFPAAAVAEREIWRRKHAASLSFLIASLLLALMAWGFTWGQIRRRLHLSSDPSDEVQTLILGAITSDKPSREALDEWRNFMRKYEDDARSHPKWLALNATEQELAYHLVQHLPIKEIAERMSCTVGHLYNVRSSIRKKWDMQPEDDLIAAIATVRNAPM